MTDDREWTEADIDKARREVAKLYHDTMMDLVLKGESVVGRRRFWKDEEGVIRYEDLPEETPEPTGGVRDPLVAGGSEEDQGGADE